MIRAALSLLIILFLGCGQSLAKVAVSPVIIAAEKVQAGQVFEVLCRQLGEEPVEVRLSLALFERDHQGGVVLLEDVSSVERVEQLLAVERRQFLLQPGQGEVVRIKVLRTDFEVLNGVLFITPAQQGGLSTRCAVLLLLYANGGETRLGAAWGGGP
ncbi:hypothetical protein [Candidatus Darwinibacter acetoxidans]|jgi:hypothetical protein|nr:hypothetical protein [Bacillota bacterium]